MPGGEATEVAAATLAVSRKKVLVTGAYGLIGNLVYGPLAACPDLYDTYGSARRDRPSKRLPDFQCHSIQADHLRLADLKDLAAVQRAVDGMDVVVHMAADAGGVSWESILNNNVVGTYHVFEACLGAGVGRVIFASSSQVSFGSMAEEPYRAIAEAHAGDLPAVLPPVSHEQRTRPLNVYAASKVWGEALAHVYAYTHGLSCICLRIGWVLPEDRPRSTRMGADWCSQRDIVQLVERCIAAPDSLRFDIFYGVSDNRYRFVDLEHAREVVGYVPQDRAEGCTGGNA